MNNFTQEGNESKPDLDHNMQMVFLLIWNNTGITCLLLGSISPSCFLVK